MDDEFFEFVKKSSKSQNVGPMLDLMHIFEAYLIIMASTKVFLRSSKKKEDGSHPLVLRIIKDRKSRLIYLGVYLKAEQWNEKDQCVRKSHPNSARINNLIIKKLAESDDLLLDVEVNNKEISVSQVKKTLKRAGKGVTFFSLAEERYKDYVKLGKHGVAGSDKSKVNNFKDFLEDEDIRFEDITVSLVDKFKIYLSSFKKLSPRSVMNHLLLIRTIFNKAIADGLVDQKYYPFGKGKVKIKLPESLKIGLDETEVQKIIDLELEEDSTLFHARNKWLFSFYFAGMRISDVLQTKWSDFSDGRLNYRMGKNQKIVSVKIPEKLKDILDYYSQKKTSKNDFVFPDMKTADLNDKKDIYRKLNTAIKNTNDYLKVIASKAEIEKKLSNHIARHTFGNIAGDKISPQMLQKLYRHTDIRTTMGYQANFIHKSADEALDSVVNF
jgi:integrase